MMQEEAYPNREEAINAWAMPVIIARYKRYVTDDIHADPR
jgi:hypothetical protein